MISSVTKLAPLIDGSCNIMSYLEIGKDHRFRDIKMSELAY